MASLQAQENNNPYVKRESKWSIRVSAGFQYNFQSDMGAPIRRDGHDIMPRVLPDNSGLIFDQKNRVGTALSYDLTYSLRPDFAVGIGFTHTSNWGRYYISVINGNMVTVLDHVRLRNINRFYYVFVHAIPYKLKKWKPDLEAGIYLLDPHYAEVIVKWDYFESRIRSGFNEYHLATWGIWFGCHYRLVFSPKFSLGIQSRIFWSAGRTRFENITFTPYLKYLF